MRQTEWYAMLPSDEIRGLVDMTPRITFLRAFAAEAAARHDIQNMVERDLENALGPYYQYFR